MNKIKCFVSFILIVAFSSCVFAKGGHLIIAMNGKSEPANLDSQLDPYDSAKVLNNFVADRLVFINPNGAQYEPHLATGWSVSSNNLTWTFKLRKGVKFQDGTNFNAQAVKSNIERILDPNTGSGEAAAEFGLIKSINADSDYKLIITTKEPFPGFLHTLATQLVIWSPTALKKYSISEFSNKLVGTGPFKLTKWIPNNYASFERWDDYNWGPSIKKPRFGPVHLDKITVKFIDEQLVRGTIITTDDANMIWDTPAQFVSRYENSSDYKVVSGFQAGTGMQYVMNITKPPLNNILVRKAIRYATNQNALNELVYEGRYLPMGGPLNNVHTCYNSAIENRYAFDLNKAKMLLAEAGYHDRDGDGIVESYGVAGLEDGTPLRVLWTALSRQAKGEALQGQLRMAGINLELEIVPGPVQLERAQKKTFDLMYERQRIPVPDVLHLVYYSKNTGVGGWAWTGFEDSNLDKILSTMKNSVDPVKACDYAKKAQVIIQENAIQLPTLGQAMIYVHKSELKGFQLGAQGGQFYVYNMYIE